MSADPAEAAGWCAAGVDVVVVVAPGRPAPRCPGPGRLAVLVGDAGDPTVLEAAEEMAAELFGPTGHPGTGPRR